MKKNFVSNFFFTATVLAITTSHSTWCMWQESAQKEYSSSITQELRQLAADRSEGEETPAQAEEWSCSKRILNATLLIGGVAFAMFAPPLMCESGTCEGLTLTAGVCTTMYAVIQYAREMKNKKAPEDTIVLLREMKDEKEQT